MSCPISWSIIIKRETIKAKTIFCFSPSLLCKIALRHVRSAVESGSVAYSNITAVSHEYFGVRGMLAKLAWMSMIPRIAEAASAKSSSTFQQRGPVHDDVERPVVFLHRFVQQETLSVAANRV